MKLWQLRKMAADTIERTNSGDDTAEGEFRAWCLANAGDVAHAMATDEHDTRAAIEAFAGESFARIILQTCDANRKRVRDRDQGCRDRDIACAAARVVESAEAVAGGWVLDGSALLVLAKLVRGDRCVGFLVGNVAVHVRARVVRNLAGVRDVRSWTAVLDVDAGHVCIVAPGAGYRPTEIRARDLEAEYTAGYHAYAVFPDCSAVDTNETARDVAVGAIPRALESNTRVWQVAS